MEENCGSETDEMGKGPHTNLLKKNNFEVKGLDNIELMLKIRQFLDKKELLKDFRYYI